MADIIGLHDRAAERIARREMPDLAEAKELLAGYTSDQIQAIAVRGFQDPAALSADETAAMLAYTRVRFA